MYLRSKDIPGEYTPKKPKFSNYRSPVFFV